MIFLQRPGSSCRLVAVAAAVAAVGACDSPFRVTTDPSRCNQTYEFGNYGCADIVGQVYGSAGQPLPGIMVSTGHVPDDHGFNTASDETDADGRFQLRLIRYNMPVPSGEPDTVSLYLRAVDLYSGSVGGPASVRDSVLIQVTLAPVGSPAPVTNVALRLPK